MGIMAPSRSVVQGPSIEKHRQEILYLVEKYPLVVVLGSTGSATTTQIPQYLYAAGWTSNGRMIGCTQPQQIAAQSAAKRVASDLGQPIGQNVGYTIELEDKCHENLTRIKYLTDGMLFREIMVDPLLSRYNVLMIGEAHERSVCTDLVLGLLKLILQHRKDLRIIICLATLDADQICKFFARGASSDQISKLLVDGPKFPLDIHYLKQPCDNYVTATIEAIIAIHENEPAGDVLAFLTSREEIEEVVSTLQTYSIDKNGPMRLHPLPLYSGLPQSEFDQVFEPSNEWQRRVIISSNIAETSVTVDGIAYVVDCGFQICRRFQSATFKDCSVKQPISKSSAQLRAGRCGQVKGGGKVYRLYTRQAFDGLSATIVPEIVRANLIDIIPRIKYIGIKQIAAFPFISPPPKDNLAKSLEFLHILGALDDKGELTELGRMIAELPIHPVLSAVLFKAHESGCLSEALTIAAMAMVKSIFVATPNHDNAGFKQLQFAVEEGDHLTLINVFQSFQQATSPGSWCKKNFINHQSLTEASAHRAQLASYMAKYDIKEDTSCTDTEQIRKCFLQGYFSQAAVAQADGSYRSLLDGSTLWIHPSSTLYERMPQYVMYHDLVESKRTYMLKVSIIEAQWLMEICPQLYEIRDVRKEERLSNGINR